MHTCANCGQPFEPDPIVTAFHAMIGDGLRTIERHGEMGVLKPGPLLCDACCKLPPEELAAVIRRLSQ